MRSCTWGTQESSPTAFSCQMTLCSALGAGAPSCAFPSCVLSCGSMPGAPVISTWGGGGVLCLEHEAALACGPPWLLFVSCGLSSAVFAGGAQVDVAAVLLFRLVYLCGFLDARALAHGCCGEDLAFDCQAAFPHLSLFQCCSAPWS